MAYNSEHFHSIRKGTGTTYKRKRYSLIEGDDNIGITVTDDPSGAEVDITIAAALQYSPAYRIYPTNGSYAARSRSGALTTNSDPTALINGRIAALDNSVKKQKIELIGDFTLVEDGSLGYAMFADSNTILDMRQARFFLANGEDCDMLRVESANTNWSGAILIGGYFDGNKANQNPTGGETAHGIVVHGGAQNILQDITLRNIDQDGVRLQNVGDTPWAGWQYLRNVRVWAQGRYGFYTNYQNDCDFVRCIVQGPSDLSTGDSSFYIWYPQNFYRCHPTYSGKHAFELLGGGNVLVNCYGNVANQHVFRLNSDNNKLLGCHGDYASQYSSLSYDVININGSDNQVIGGYFNGMGNAYPDHARWALYEESGNYNLGGFFRLRAGTGGGAISTTGGATDFDHYTTHA